MKTHKATTKDDTHAKTKELVVVGASSFYLFLYLYIFSFGTTKGKTTMHNQKT